MDRLISEQQVLKVLDSLKANFTCYDWVTLDEVASHVKAIPSAEPRYYPPCEDCNKKMNEIRKAYDKIQSAEPKTGHWIFEGNQCFSCSSCGRIYTQKAFEYLKLNKDDSDFPNNCPNCGAKMVER